MAHPAGRGGHRGYDCPGGQGQPEAHQVGCVQPRHAAAAADDFCEASPGAGLSQEGGTESCAEPAAAHAAVALHWCVLRCALWAHLELLQRCSELRHPHASLRVAAAGAAFAAFAQQPMGFAAADSRHHSGFRVTPSVDVHQSGLPDERPGVRRHWWHWLNERLRPTGHSRHEPGSTQKQRASSPRSGRGLPLQPLAQDQQRRGGRRGNHLQAAGRCLYGPAAGPLCVGLVVEPRR
mmetsp:Transcript_97903/g.227019  ORF Transcript_97903/g.227019 Transcript_97903/m.227019 type:complete len:236 (-) Transcript_97903:276-983(-)